MEIASREIIGADLSNRRRALDRGQWLNALIFHFPVVGTQNVFRIPLSRRMGRG